MGLYELYRLDRPEAVVQTVEARTSEEALELAQASGVKENTLVAAMVGKTPGHDLVPVVKGYMEKHRGGKEAAV